MTEASFPQASDGLDRRPLLTMPTPAAAGVVGRDGPGSFEPFSSTRRCAGRCAGRDPVSDAKSRLRPIEVTRSRRRAAREQSVLDYCVEKRFSLNTPYLASLIQRSDLTLGETTVARRSATVEPHVVAHDHLMRRAGRLRHLHDYVANRRVGLGRKLRDADRWRLHDRGLDDLVDSLALPCKLDRRRVRDPVVLVLVYAIEQRPAIDGHGAHIDGDVLVLARESLAVEDMRLLHLPSASACSTLAAESHTQGSNQSRWTRNLVPFMLRHPGYRWNHRTPANSPSFEPAARAVRVEAGESIRPGGLVGYSEAKE